MTALAKTPPMYGTKPATRTTTASGPASGTPRIVRKTKAATASTEAIVAVPRMYPPARRIASSPAVRIRTRRHSRRSPQADVPALLAVEQEVERQEQAEHDDRRDARDRADEGGRLGAGPRPGPARRSCRASWRPGTGRRLRPCPSSSLATPAWAFWASSTRDGTSGEEDERPARRSRRATAIRSRAPADALARPQPRARSRSCSGLSVATAITPKRMDRVTVER